MKCIYCSANSKLKDRTSNGAKCSACKHPFAFEPTKDTYRITDGAFQALIKAVSGKAESFFTDRQLWYEFNRRLLRKSFWRAPYGWVAGVCVPAGVVVGFIGIPIAGAAAAIGGTFIALGGLTGSAFLCSRVKKKAPGFIKVEFRTFVDQYLHRWEKAHGKIEKLLRPDN